MPFNINEMRAQLVGGGSRVSHFQVVITNPINGSADLKAPFMIKAASIPTVQINKIEIPYFGRKIGVPGDRVWEDWTTTVINDEDHLVRNALESWSNAMNAFQRNFATLGSNPNLYKSQAQITAYGKDMTALRIYQFNGIWPMTISSIEKNWETQDTLDEFTVTWSFDDMEIVGGVTGDAGGS
ncbi:tail tube protein [Rhizobium phage RHph_I1_18]|nr:tail tube protein [Rhizobium phage RHph_I1_18]